MKPCTEKDHDNVVWKPLETEAHSDGTYDVVQWGTCTVCKTKLLLTYSPNEPREVE